MSIQAASRGNMPVVLLKEGASETKGREAQKNNIQAAKIIARGIRDANYRSKALVEIAIALRSLKMPSVF